MDNYKELIESLRICVKYQKAVDALCNVEFAVDVIEQLVKERDAVMADFHDFTVYAASKDGTPFACNWCRNYVRGGRCRYFMEHEGKHICRGEHFEWRGTKENNDDTD